MQLDPQGVWRILAGQGPPEDRVAPVGPQAQRWGLSLLPRFPGGVQKAR